MGKVGEYLGNLGKGFANTVTGGLAGAAVDGILGLFGGGSKGFDIQDQEWLMKRQTALEKEKMKEQFEYNKQMAAFNQDLAKEMFNYTGYGAQVQQMKDADLNPALMYGMGSGSGGSTSGAGRGEGVDQSTSQAIGLALQAEQMKANIALTQAETTKAMAEANKIASADTTNVQTDTKHKESLMMVNESLNSLNKATSELRGAETSLTNEKIELTRVEISKANENLKSLMRNNEIGDAIKGEMIKKAILDNAVAYATIWEKDANINLKENESQWIAKQIEGYWYGLISDRIKASAAQESAEAAQRTADANILHAEADWQNSITKREMVLQLAYKIKKEVEKWGKELDMQQERLLQDWIYRGVDSVVDIAGAVSPFKLAGMVKESKSVTYGQDGKPITTRWDWERNRPSL